jgi:hypothetical protein
MRPAENIPVMGGREDKGDDGGVAFNYDIL